MSKSEYQAGASTLPDDIFESFMYFNNSIWGASRTCGLKIGSAVKPRRRSATRCRSLPTSGGAGLEIKYVIETHLPRFVSGHRELRTKGAERFGTQRATFPLAVKDGDEVRVEREDRVVKRRDIRRKVVRARQ